MDKKAGTQGNEGQGDSKGFRIKLLYRVCDNSEVTRRLGEGLRKVPQS